MRTVVRRSGQSAGRMGQSWTCGLLVLWSLLATSSQAVTATPPVALSVTLDPSSPGTTVLVPQSFMGFSMEPLELVASVLGPNQTVFTQMLRNLVA